MYSEDINKKFSNLITRELDEIKKDAIYLCKAALDFYEMGEETLARYLAEQAKELVSTYTKAKRMLEDESVNEESLIAMIQATEKVVTV